VWAAAARGDVAGVERFVRAGTPLDDVDPLVGVTALQWAVAFNRGEIVAWLLDARADPCALGRDLSTALHTAAFLGQVACAKQLLTAGAEETVALHNSMGQTPIDVSYADMVFTKMICTTMNLPLDMAQVEKGRQQIRELFNNPPSTEIGSDAYIQAILKNLRTPAAIKCAIEARKWFEETAGDFPIDDEAECRELLLTPDMDGVEVTARGADPDFIVLYFHGGAHFLGSWRTHRALIGRLSDACGASVVAVNYRLAPEHPFPAGLDDAYTALHWIYKHYPRSRVAVGGDSAGGNMAFALLVRLAQLGEAQPVCCFTFAPWLLLDIRTQALRKMKNSGDELITFESASQRLQKTKGNPMDSIAYVTGAAHICVQYFQDHPGSDPQVSPVLADEELVKKFPPCLIHVDTSDPLIDDARQMAQLFLRAGADMEFKVYQDCCHVFQAMPHQYPEEAADSMRRTADFIMRNF